MKIDTLILARGLARRVSGSSGLGFRISGAYHRSMKTRLCCPLPAQSHEMIQKSPICWSHGSSEGCTVAARVQRFRSGCSRVSRGMTLCFVVWDQASSVKHGDPRSETWLSKVQGSAISSLLRRYSMHNSPLKQAFRSLYLAFSRIL